MDQKDLGLDRYDAGARYLDALRNLRLEPEALFWAYDNTVEKFVLVLVTSLFDFVGPLALSQLLFQAYNASATPPEINPFIIRLHSTKHALYLAVKPHLGSRYDQANLKGVALDRATIAGEAEPAAAISFKVNDLEGFATWIYVGPLNARRPARDPDQRWRRFERAVHAATAA